MTQTLIEKLNELPRHSMTYRHSGVSHLVIKVDDLRAIIEQAKAEKQDADETHNGYIEGTAERLRLICSKLGIGAPVSNEEIMFCQFSLFGAIRRKIEEIYTTPQPDIVAELVEALEHSRACLEAANNSGLINDTLWAGNAETLFDYMDAAVTRAKEYLK